MIKEIIGNLNLANINADNIGMIIVMLAVALVVIRLVIIKLQEALKKFFGIAVTVIGIICLIGIQQGTLEQWMTQATTFIK
jgi:hypothetical protein